MGVWCPALLLPLLAVNELLVDESTSRDGNCGISAFVISLLALLKGGQRKKGTSSDVRRLQSLRRCPPGQQVTQARAATIEWLAQHAQTNLREGMTVSGLTHAVTGEDFPSYVQRMQRNGEWVDTASTHALACAFGVTVLVFQEGVDPAIIGPHLIDGDNGDCDLVVPVALVNDYHFWAVVKSTFPREASAPWVRDKGELVAFQTKGLHPGLGSEVPKVAAPGVFSHQAHGPRLHMEQEDGDEEHRPDCIPQQVRSPEEIDAELHFCVALSRWCPWSTPTDETVQAIQGLARFEAGCTDALARCLARQKAMEELAYESVHYQSLPEAMRYQRGARRHLISPREWQQGCKARAKTRQYISTCSKLVGPVALASEMEGWACARGDMQAHGRFCVGATSFCPKVIIIGVCSGTPCHQPTVESSC